MKNYRDSSALIETTVDLTLRRRLPDEVGFTRPHALSEMFSALTAGNVSIRTAAEAAAQIIEDRAGELESIDLTVPDMLAALKKSKTARRSRRTRPRFSSRRCRGKSGRG